jgi:hypothetical protein
VLRATFGTVHWPLLVAASLALLAVRPFPTHLLSYAARAEELAARFRELLGLSASKPGSLPWPPICELSSLHQAFKSLECPDEARAYHWAVSEAMRLDLDALACESYLERAVVLKEAERYWRRAADEARRFAQAM